MNWFEELCRNVGLMVHNVKHPDSPTGIAPPENTHPTHHTEIVSKTVQERKLDENTTLRRTTIDEVEIKHDL